MKLTLTSLSLALLSKLAVAQCTILGTGAIDPTPPIDGWEPGFFAIGFPFPFNGTTYTHFYYSDHGLIALNNAGTPAVPLGGAQVWDATTANMATMGADCIFAYWGDHTAGAAPAGIYLDNTSGTHCTITWVDSEPYFAYTAGAFTAQVTLYPSGAIVVCLDNRCNNTSSTFGGLNTIVGVHQNGFTVPASSDLSSNTVVTLDPTVFQLFVGPGPSFTNTPDPNFDLGNTTIQFIPTSPGWAVLVDPLTCAATATLGSGCNGLTLTSTTPPVIGGSWGLSLSGITAPAPFPNFLGWGSQIAPTPVGILFPGLFGPTCNAYMDLGLGLVDIGPATAGVANFSLPLPPTANLKGLMVTTQGVSFNIAGPDLFGLSNGEAGTVGY